MIVVMKFTRTEDGAEPAHRQAEDPQIPAEPGENVGVDSGA